MKKINITVLFILMLSMAFGQETKKERKEAKVEKINLLIKQSEEGVLIYNKQSIFGIQGRTNGYGIFYELAKMKTNRKSNIYRIDLTEIKHLKEVKASNGNGLFFGNPFIYGKINNFYQLTLGFGQQHILGQKGNKNGVSISAVYNGGLALGLLRPYYIEVQDPLNSENKVIRYTEADRALFLSGASIVGGGGFGKGWSEIKVKPGAYAKTALRFDFGRYNETVSGFEIGVSADFYGSKIPILVDQKDKQFFFQGYIAVVFGRRK